MSIIDNPLKASNDIEYLMRRKFPEEKGDDFVKDMIRNLSLLSSDHSTRNYNSQELHYLELIKKPKIEIQNLVNQEKLKEEHEKGFFFDQPSANADFQEFYRMPNWSIEEAIALSLGKNPRIVNPASLDNYSNYNRNFNSTYKSSSLYKDYKLRVETLIRYIDAKKISTRPTPLEFINWLQENDFSIPKELEKLVYKRWGKPNNLEDYGEKYKKIINENEAIYKRTITQYQNDLIASKNLIAELQDKLKNSVKPNESRSKSQLQRKINNLLKLLYCIAEEKYSHKPGNEAATAYKLETLVTSKIKDATKKQSIEGYLKKGQTITNYLEEGGDLVRDIKIN